MPDNVDGLRLPSAWGFTRPTFDPFVLQQIEVLKGPSAILFGHISPGGLVNLVSKTPLAGRHGEFEIQGTGYN